MKTPAAILLSLLLLAGWPAAGFAEENRVDPRESAVDRALGGMVEGSRMPGPEGSFGERGRQVPGSMLSPATNRSSTSAPAALGSSAGPGLGASPGAGVGTANEPAGGSFESSAPSGPEETVPDHGGSDLGGGATGGGAGGGDLGGTIDSEPSGGGAIIDIDAGVSTEGGTVDANLDLGVDTEAGSLLELDAATDVVAEEPVAAEIDSTQSALIETDLGVEEGINEAPASGEVDAGLEADVDASGEPDEPVDNPADGLAL